MSNRSGIVLLEVLCAMAVIATAATASVALVRQLSVSTDHAVAREREAIRAAHLLAHRLASLRQARAMIGSAGAQLPAGHNVEIAWFDGVARVRVVAEPQKQPLLQTFVLSELVEPVH